MSTVNEDRITIPVQLRFADVDMAGHVHHSVFLHWLELARMALSKTFIPLDHDWLKEGMILARMEIDHRMPVRLDDTIEADAWCSALGNKSFDLSYTIRRIGGDRPGVCAEGRSVMVCFNYDEQHAIAVPGPWRLALERSMTA